MSTTNRMIVVGVVLVAIALGLFGLTAWSLFAGRADIVIGGKNFTEQDILVYLMAELIEHDTGLAVETKTNLGGSPVCFSALESGDLDIYAEYTGTALMSLLGREIITDADEAYQVVDAAFNEKHHLDWLQPFGFNNAYTITVRRATAEELGLRTVSDLAQHVKSNTGGDRLTAGFDSEFLVRTDGYPGLKDLYDFEFASKPMHLDPGLMYQAVASDQVDVICGFATDGRIPAYDLVILEDDKDLFPPYYAAPVVRKATLEKHPDLKATLNKLAGRLPDETMQQLNFEVDEEGRKARVVARDFLIREGLISESDQ